MTESSEFRHVTRLNELLAALDFLYKKHLQRISGRIEHSIRLIFYDCFQEFHH